MTNPLPALSLAAVPGRRIATLELARDIERRGFSGIYCPSFGDALGVCQALAVCTDTIPFGTSIVNIYGRSAGDYAQSAALLHEVSEGRFRFGIGVSHQPMNDQLGLVTGKPLADTRSFVEAVKATTRIGDAPPIVLAATRDKMAALATEIGDGMVFANAARSAVPGTIERLPKPAGADFFIGGMIPTCISDDRDAAAAVNRRTLTMYLGFPNYRNYWKDSGYGEQMEAVEAALAAGNHEVLPSLMTDKWLADCTLYGSRAEVLEGLEAWYDAGLTTPILVPSSATGGQMQAFAELFALFE